MIMWYNISIFIEWDRAVKEYTYACYLENWSNKISWHLTNIVANKQFAIIYVLLVILCT